MLEGDRECPQCRGRGGNIGLVYGCREGRSFTEERRLPCTFCGGSGRVALDALAGYWRGRALAAERKSRGVTQAQEAERLGISVQELSKREWGRA